MAKTLVIAEKPSVGRDLARVLPGPFIKSEGYLEGPEHVITWAVGHLVQLAEPDEYKPEWKKWRMADLPIVPEHFKLVVRDERSKKQMNVIKRQLARDDIDKVVNACDAGREGELIFAYVYEAAGAKKPVQRLWLQSMTKGAIQQAFGHLIPAEEKHRLEEAARSRSEADWIVGMNATRAATIRLRSSFDGAVSLGRVQTPTLALLAQREEEIRSFEPEPYWLVDAVFAAPEERVYEGHAALTYPRTNSRFLPSDLRGEIKPTAELLGRQRPYAAAAHYVTGLDVLPLGRVVNDKKVTDHHAIIPTRAEHNVAKFNADDKKIYDLVVRRFLAVFHPDAEFENTRVETTVAERVFRTRGRVLLVPGWRGVYGETAEGDERPGREGEDDEGREQRLPKLDRGEAVETREVEAIDKETQPPRRYSDASLLAAMETAGKLVDDEELREAMKDSGIGTPATRAAIIERLITVGYIERDGRALVCTEKGLNVIRLLGEHPLTSPSLTGDWEHRLTAIEEGQDSREKFMGDIERFAEKTVTELDTKLKDVRIPRANLGPCPVCGRDINENRKGYSCWGRDDPGCGFVIWKGKAGKQLPVSVARELITRGRTAKPVTGFKSRAGRNFRARLELVQNDEGKWRVEFDEPWAKEGAAKPPDAETEEAAAEETSADETSAAA